MAQSLAVITLRNCIVKGWPSTFTLIAWESPSSGAFGNSTANVSEEI
jgi:hypothetical protein